MPKGLQIDVTDEKTLPDVAIPATGDVKRDDLIQEVEVETSGAKIDDRAAELAFMEEPVKIMLHESTNPNDEQYVMVSVNCESPIPGVPWLKRGQEYTIARKFVLNLITAKTVSYTQPFKDMPSDRSNYMRPHTAMKYPFSILEDTPKGRNWTQQMMAGA